MTEQTAPEERVPAPCATCGEAHPVCFEDMLSGMLFNALYTAKEQLSPRAGSRSRRLSRWKAA
jgi:hypothetical protein